MPIHEYACNACEEKFEVLVRKDDAPACPACGATDLERLISLPTVVSESTRRSAMRAAKKRDAAQATDRMHERVKYEESHDRHG